MKMNKFENKNQGNQAPCHSSFSGGDHLRSSLGIICSLGSFVPCTVLLESRTISHGATVFVNLSVDIFNVDSNSNAAKSSSHENGRNSMLEPLLSKRLDSVLQTSGKHSNWCISSSHHSSLSVRRKALAEAVAAKQDAEFD